MKRMVFLIVAMALLASAPSVLAGASSTKACNGSKLARQLHLKVHGVSCTTALKDAGFAKGDPYKCKTKHASGSTITHINCVNRKHKTKYFAYQVTGSL